jgi:hypothetical protein
LGAPITGSPPWWCMKARRVGNCARAWGVGRPGVLGTEAAKRIRDLAIRAGVVSL